MFGGRPSDERIRRTGRIDVQVRPEGDPHDAPIGLQWEVTAD